MASFDKAIGVILKHEGGWVDDPDDAGKETNFGISTLIIQREKITAEDLGIPSFYPGALKLMTVDTAKKLYKRLFWDKYEYDKIDDQTIATKVFDCAVNCGPGRSHIMIQDSAVHQGADLVIDGQLGPKSFAAINACDPTVLVNQMAEEMKAYYLGIIARKPKQVKFKNNWLRRARWGVK